MYQTFAFYIPDYGHKDGHKVGRNKWEFTVCIKLILLHMCTLISANVVCIHILPVFKDLHDMSK